MSRPLGGGVGWWRTVHRFALPGALALGASPAAAAEAVEAPAAARQGAHSRAAALPAPDASPAPLPGHSGGGAAAVALAASGATEDAGPGSSEGGAGRSKGPAEAGSSAAAELADAAPADEVRVTARRARRLTASRSYVSARDFRAIPRRSAADALKLVPGLVLVQHGTEGKGHQMLLRGFDAVHGSDFEVTVAGIPINEWSNVHAQGYLDLAFIVPEAIESVEVVKGPFSLDQGAFAMAGSARYRLGVDRSGAVARYTVGSTGRHRAALTLAPQAGDGRTFLAAEALTDAGFGQRRRADRLSALGQWVTRAPGAGELRFVAAGYSGRFELPGALRLDTVEDAGGPAPAAGSAGEASPMGFYDAFDHQQEGRSRRLLVGASYRWLGAEPGAAAGTAVEAAFHAGLRDFTLLENFTGFLEDPINGDRRFQRHDSRVAGGRLKAAWPWSLGHAAELTVHAGVYGRVERIEQYQQARGLELEPLAVERDLSATQALFGGRLGLEAIVAAGLRVQAGARWDWAHITARDAGAASLSEATAALSPRVSVDYQLLERTTLFASWGRGFRPPQARGLSAFSPDQTEFDTSAVASSEARITSAEASELGLRQRLGPSWQATVAGYLSRLEREQILDHIAGTTVELGRTRRIGAEAALAGRILSALELALDLTWVDARLSDLDQRVPSVPRWLSNLRLRYSPGERWDLALRAYAIGARPLTRGAVGSGQGGVDLVGHARAGRFQFGIELENVLNRRNREGEYFFASRPRLGDPPSALPALHYSAGPPRNARLTVSAEL